MPCLQISALNSIQFSLHDILTSKRMRSYTHSVASYWLALRLQLLSHDTRYHLDNWLIFNELSLKDWWLRFILKKIVAVRCKVRWKRVVRRNCDFCWKRFLNLSVCTSRHSVSRLRFDLVWIYCRFYCKNWGLFWVNKIISNNLSLFKLLTRGFSLPQHFHFIACVA